MSDRDFVALLNRELSDRLACRFVQADGAVDHPLAMMIDGSRSISVMPGDVELLVHFRQGDRSLAHGATSDITSAVGSAVVWIQGAGLEQLAAAYSFVRFSGLQLAYERGDATEFQWKSVLEDVEGDFSNYRDLVTQASRDDVLRGMFPHLGHRFALSADEYSEDVLVAVFMFRTGWYGIYTHDGEGVEFEGNAHEMVTYVKNKLRRYRS